MAARRVNGPNSEPSRRRTASTPEARERQMTNLAVDLAERQLREGTASAQVITHYLKASSSRERLEQERIAMDVELQRAKIEQLEATARIETLYEDAIKAMRNYSGHTTVREGEDYDA